MSFKLSGMNIQNQIKRTLSKPETLEYVSRLLVGEDEQKVDSLLLRTWGRLQGGNPRPPGHQQKDTSPPSLRASRCRPRSGIRA